MEFILLGKGPFEIGPVIKLLREDETSYSLLCQRWKRLGYSLFIDEDRMKSLQEKFQSGKLELHKMPREVLRVWRNLHEDDATLSDLYEALKDIALEDLAGSLQKRFEGCDSVTLPPPSKKIKLSLENEVSESSRKTEPVYAPAPDLNVPDENGVFPLFRAIRSASVEEVKCLLDQGCNPNIKKPKGAYSTGDNAAHVVAWSLIYNKRSIKDALEILTLLATSGFTLINEPDTSGSVPLSLLPMFKGLNKELLIWFFENGADPDVMTEAGVVSVLFRAIYNRQDIEIIRTILKYNGNPRHVDMSGQNALHWSAEIGHSSAMKLFINRIDVNQRDDDKCTPLHQLFMKDGLDYQPCLEMLLEKGADFEAVNDGGNVPLIQWIQNAEGNPFPALNKVKDKLPISQDIASRTLTFIVQEMEWTQRFLPSSTEANGVDFVEFIIYLIEEQDADLNLDNEEEWGNEEWKRIKQCLKDRDFTKMLRQWKCLMKWKGEFTSVRQACVENGNCKKNILLLLLHCKMYDIFIDVCESLSQFCAHVIGRVSRHSDNF